MDANMMTDLAIQNDRERVCRMPGWMPVIRRDEMLWVLKDSRVEWEQKTKGLSEEQALAALSAMGAGESGQVVVSHNAQKAVRRACEVVAAQGTVISFEELSEEKLVGKKLVIVIGGDDHFKRVSHSIPPGVKIMGLNSDPVRSRGALLSQAAENLEGMVQDLERGCYEVELWSRLAVAVNGT